ncbi:putative fatty acyl-CoA reductase CG5065 isoform X2 [Halyomorpha halys]|uniref:putative fatty acyl-CoA reductase CG5065 isoform X2 n=1 Tax=Halyomorpha halys TaxID=286706 RepID=UPI0006D4FF07|nr:putative fatty acyl-CoA reductase CG5065 isoform X2 [Halyomorpha halys]
MMHIHEVLDMKPSTIKEYFDGQSIFITGSTGTLGKILVEKILRCCPGVARVYLLIREKKNIPIAERWKQITDLPLFDVLKETNPKALDKVTPVQGDLVTDNMELSKEDEQNLIENVTMIYHMGAMVQFTDSLTLAFENNTKATYMLLNFARRVKNLQLFVYVSTAFCNMNIPCDKAVEEVIPATLDWRLMMKLLESQPLVLDALKEKLLSGQPNPYTWSKWLAEQIVNDYRVYFPTIIARPAAVCSTIRDPFPAWIDTIGICGIVHAAAYGILRIIYTRWDSYLDYIPADAAINAMLVAAWKKPSPERTDVYNCCMVKDVSIITEDYQRYGRAIVENAPSKHIVWPYHCFVTTNELLYRIMFILLQVVPAALVDLVNLLQNKKIWALKLTTKMANLTRVYKKFIAVHLEFPNDKYKALNDVIPETEWDSFNTVYEDLTNEKIISFGYESIKKYYLKEETNERSVIRNKRRLFWLKVMDEILIFCFWMIGVYLLYKVIASRLPF